MSESRITFHAIGRWKADEVIVDRAAESRPRIPEVEEAIERTWTEKLKITGIRLFDGPMCRLEYFQADSNLRLGLSHTSYKVFVGTNLSNSNLADRFGPEVLANAVGMSCAVESSDGFLLLGRRNSSVAYYPGRIHPFAGTLEASEKIDVFAEARRELAEELGFSVADIKEIVCIGMVEDRSLRQPELIFAVKSVRTRNEIIQKIDSIEHNGYIAFEAQSNATSQAIKDSSFTPVAVATVLLWGREIFGTEWFDGNLSSGAKRG